MRRNLILILILFVSCRKYNEVPLPANAAYFRVFNGLTNFSHVNSDLTTILQGRPVSARITVFVDPDTDANGILNTAALADNLYPKAYYNAPQPDQAGLALAFDVDYPGSKLVATAPVVNGLDMSRWASITAGKHRFVFSALPLGATTAAQVNSIRFNTLIDTTIDLQAGHFYTLEPLNDSARFRLYARDEAFEKIQYDTAKLNVRFVNMCSGKTILPDTFDVYYRYHYFTDQTFYDPQNGFLAGYVETDDSINTLLTTITKRFATSEADAPYFSIPLAPADKSYWSSGALAGTIKPSGLRPCLVFSFCKPGKKPPTAANPTAADLPLLQFVCAENFNDLYYGSSSLFAVNMDSIPGYYGRIPTSYYAFYNQGSSNNVHPALQRLIAGKLWEYTFISGLPVRRQPLISTIEFQDNYSYVNGAVNTYTIDKSNLRIYVTGVQSKYGNPY